MALPGLLFHGEGAVTADGILLLSALRPSRSDSKSAEAENTVKRSSRRTGVNLQYFRLEPSSLGLKGASSPFFATTTTAACGRNREELLGQWPAGCETRPRVEADTGCHNPQHPARRNRWHFSGSRLRSNESPSGAFKRQSGLASARWRGFAPTSSAFGAKREHIRRKCALQKP